MSEKSLIWVDKKDRIIGYGEKIETHRLEQLHRAFSLFIYCKEQDMFLLQKRDYRKYHSGGKWSNSCCSHPYRNENWKNALQRCASDELNIKLKINDNIICDSNMRPQYMDKKLYYAGSFIYYSQFDDLSEHEYDYVFLYLSDDIEKNICFNKSEVSEVLWVKKDLLEQWMIESPNDFSAWFKEAYEVINKQFSSIFNE